MIGGVPDADTLWAWLLGLRDPLLSVEHRLAAQSGVLRLLQDVPGATTDTLAGVLTAIGEALAETADAIDWGPLQIDGRPAVRLLTVQVGRFRIGDSTLPPDRVIRILMAPPRISRVFDEPLPTAAWGVVAAATAPDIPMSPPPGPVGLGEARGRIGELLAAATGRGVDALAVAETVFASARWMLAANDVIGREWAPSENMLRAALDDAITTSTRLG